MQDLSPSSNSEERTAKVENLEIRRLRYGFILLITSIVIILAMFGLVAIRFSDVFKTDASVLSLITTTTTVIGTLVGFYFGSQVGSAGAARADAARQETVELAVKAAQGSASAPDVTALQQAPPIGSRSAPAEEEKRRTGKDRHDSSSPETPSTVNDAVRRTGGSREAPAGKQRNHEGE